MSQWFYVMPIVIEPETGKKIPKHLYIMMKPEPGKKEGHKVRLADYGPEPWGIVRHIPASTAAAEHIASIHTTLTEDPQVMAFPKNIDNTIGANAGMVETKLESINIPGDWVTGAMTYRFLIKRLAHYCYFMQRHAGSEWTPTMFEDGRTLDTTWSQLSAGAKAKITAAADSFGFDKSGLTGSATIREMLKALVVQGQGAWRTPFEMD